METMKHGNTETGSRTAFPRLHFRDRSPEIMGIETAFPGPQSRDHGNRDYIYGTAFPRSRESGLHFKYHGSGITFLQLRKQD